MKSNWLFLSVVMFNYIHPMQRSLSFNDIMQSIIREKQMSEQSNAKVQAWVYKHKKSLPIISFWKKEPGMVEDHFSGEYYLDMVPTENIREFSESKLLETIRKIAQALKNPTQEHMLNTPHDFYFNEIIAPHLSKNQTKAIVSVVAFESFLVSFKFHLKFPSIACKKMSKQLKDAIQAFKSTNAESDDNNESPIVIPLTEVIK